MANTIGTLNLLQSIVDWGLELEKFDTAGTSEEYGNVREDVAAPPRLRRRGRPHPPRALADQPEVDLRDGEGRRRLPDDELPRRVRPAGRRHAHVQQLRPASEPALRHGHDRHAGADEARDVELGALEPLRDFCFCTDGVRGHLTVAAHGVPGDVYVYGQGENISMRDWADLILRIGEEHGFWPDDRQVVTTEPRLRPGATDVMALRVGHEKLTARDRLAAEGLVGGGRAAHDPVVRGATATAGSAASTGCRPALRSSCGEQDPRHRRRRVPRLAPRRAARGRRATTSSPRGARLRPDVSGGRRARSSTTPRRSSCSTSPPRSAGSAQTAPTPAATGTRT